MTVKTGFCIILNEKLYGSFSVTHNSLSQILDQISQISLRLTNNGIKFQSQSDVITVITLTFSAFFLMSLFFCKLLIYNRLTLVVYLR